MLSMPFDAMFLLISRGSTFCILRTQRVADMTFGLLLRPKADPVSLETV